MATELQGLAQVEPAIRAAKVIAVLGAHPEEHRPVFVNGELGMALPAYGEVSARVTSFTLHEGKVLAVYDIANPDKLRHVDFWSGP